MNYYNIYCISKANEYSIFINGKSFNFYISFFRVLELILKFTVWYSLHILNLSFFKSVYLPFPTFHMQSISSYAGAEVERMWVFDRVIATQFPAPVCDLDSLFTAWTVVWDGI